jgi:hypothetical protein
MLAALKWAFFTNLTVRTENQGKKSDWISFHNSTAAMDN